MAELSKAETFGTILEELSEKVQSCCDQGNSSVQTWQTEILRLFEDGSEAIQKQLLERSDPKSPLGYIKQGLAPIRITELDESNPILDDGKAIFQELADKADECLEYLMDQQCRAMDLEAQVFALESKVQMASTEYQQKIKAVTGRVIEVETQITNSERHLQELNAEVDHLGHKLDKVKTTRKILRVARATAWVGAVLVAPTLAVPALALEGAAQ